MAVTIGIGTMKGAWIARSDDRQQWEIDGPHLKGWEIGTFGRTPGGDYLLTTSSSWYGAAIHRSDNLVDWKQIVDGPGYEEDSGRKLERIWTVAPSNGTLFAGVADAGLFGSDDDGNTWAAVTGLNDHETRDGWSPGAGGLAAHRILIDPKNRARMWVGISAVGVFATEDGGGTWELRNRGVDVTAQNDDYDIGYCVHGLVADPDDADRIWRQDHQGVYRTDDGGRSWERIEAGLPAAFGFPIVRDPASGTLFVAPQESDEYRMPVDGKFSIYRSTDDGSSWRVAGFGLPTHAYNGVLRGAMDIDGLESGGVYLGTTGGEAWWSADAGDTWERLPGAYPRITSVRVLDS